MKKKRFVRDFDYWIDEYMYNCRSQKLHPKTMQSYEQSLRLFERWCLEEAQITEPGQCTSPWSDRGAPRQVPDLHCSACYPAVY